MQCESARQDTDESSAQTTREATAQPDGQQGECSLWPDGFVVEIQTQSKPKVASGGRRAGPSPGPSPSPNGQSQWAAVQGNEATRQEIRCTRLRRTYLSRFLDHLSLLLLLLLLLFSPRAIEPLTMTGHQK